MSDEVSPIQGYLDKLPAPGAASRLRSARAVMRTRDGALGGQRLGQRFVERIERAALLSATYSPNDAMSIQVDHATVWEALTVSDAWQPR